MSDSAESTVKCVVVGKQRRMQAAVHLVNILMIRAGRYSDDMDHKTRQIFLRDHHGAIETRYDAMLSKSSRCRYEAWFTADEGYFSRQSGHLAAVQSYVDRFLADAIPSISR
jgi:hypothetical protein